MEFLSYLKHLGIQPVKARHPLPGAAPSDDALNQYYQSLVSPVSAASGAPLPAPSNAQKAQPQLAGDSQHLPAHNNISQTAAEHFNTSTPDTLANNLSTDVANTSNQHAAATQQKSVEHILQGIQNTPSQTANSVTAKAAEDEPAVSTKPTQPKQAQVAGESEKNAQQKHLTTALQAPEFTLWVYHHLGLNALVCAEVNSKVRSEVEGRVVLLQNMLKALSAQQAIQSQHQWKRDRFKWPLDVGLDNDINAAQEVFQAYFKNYQQPKTLLIFSEQYLPELLGLQEVSDLQDLQKAQLAEIWPQCPVIHAPSLQTYIDNPASKKPLWLTIKTLYS